MNTNVLNYRYCPFCSGELVKLKEEDKERLACETCRWVYYPGVSMASAAIVYRSGEVLLVRRNREPHKGTWSLPGGFLEYHEHPEDTARRELEEETNLKAITAKFIKFVKSNEDPRSPGHLVFFYLLTAKGQIANRDLDENSKVAWFKIDKLPEIGWPTHKEILQSSDLMTEINSIEISEIFSEVLSEQKGREHV